jgi:hypothetical protein
VRARADCIVYCAVADLRFPALDVRYLCTYYIHVRSMVCMYMGTLDARLSLSFSLSSKHSQAEY